MLCPFRSVLAAVLLALFVPAGPAAAQRIVAIGDSVMAWNAGQGRSIADALSGALGLPVDNRAVSGARFSNDSGLGRALGFDIRRQLGRDRPAVVVMTGGANDLRAECTCGACAGVRDSLIDARLTGEIPDFVAGLIAAGSRVVYIGYYRTRSRGYMAECTADFDALHDRMAALAERLPGLTFVSARPVMDRDDPALFAVDAVHPSPLGSALIGRHVAATMTAGGPGMATPSTQPDE